MLTTETKNKVEAFVMAMIPSQVYSFATFTNDEKEYYIYLCERQTGAKGFCIETNGISTDRSTQTKFKKLML